MRKACGRVFAIAAGIGFSLLTISAGPSHTVHPGDTLSSVAETYGVSVQVLVEANQITDPNLIRVGDILQIPGGVPPNEPRASQIYVVEDGDSLTAIASRFNSSVAELKDANALESESILIGQQLLIPAQPLPLQEVPPIEIPDQRPQNPELEQMMEEAATAEGLDPGLVKAVAWIESGWNQHALSTRGAKGIMQLMPDTIEWLERNQFGQDLNEEASVYDNIKAGARYLRLMHETTGSTQLTIVAYYQGPAITQQRIVYLETQRYVDAVLAMKARFWS